MFLDSLTKNTFRNRAPGKGEIIIQRQVFLFLNENICCESWDPSIELSQPDDSNEGSECLFLCSNEENYLSIIPVTLSYLNHCIICCLLAWRMKSEQMSSFK